MLTMDHCNLNWKQQIESVRLKVVRNLHLLRRARGFIDRPTALLLYQTIIQSHFDYCCTTWMNGHLTYLRRLQTLQNRALRIVLQVENRFNRQTLYATLDVDCLFDRWKRQELLLIFKLLNNLLPHSLCSRIEKKENIYIIRNYNNIISLPRPKSNFLKNSTLYSASKSFNSLPQDKRLITSLKLFASAISHISFDNQ